MAENKVVHQLGESIDKMLAQYTLATEEVARLQMLTAAQQRKIRTLQQQLSDTERALAQAKLSEAMTSVGRDNKAARTQINRLLREVDKCIEIVSAKSEDELGRVWLLGNIHLLFLTRSTSLMLQISWRRSIAWVSVA